MATHVIDQTPDPHLIEAFRQSEIDAPTALAEWIDNALGHGRATEVTIEITRREIVVRDNGVGVANLAPMFRYGGTSSANDRAEIGFFGVGSKDAMQFFGTRAEIVTVRDGASTRAVCDWDVTRQGWTAGGAVLHDPEPTDEPSGTVITITGLRDEVTKIHRESVEGWAKALETTYAPALRAGKTVKIGWRWTVRGETNWITLSPFSEPCTDKAEAISGAIESVHGLLRWDGYVIECDTVKDEVAKCFVAFGDRVMVADRDAFRGEAAQSVYVWVALNREDAWQDAGLITRNKRKLRTLAPELAESIHGQIAEQLKRSVSKPKPVNFRGVEGLQSLFADAMLGGGDRCAEPKEKVGLGEEGTITPPTPDPENPFEPVKKVKPEDPECADPNASPEEAPSGVSIVPERFAGWLGDKLYSCEVRPGSVTITLDLHWHKDILERGTKDNGNTTVISSYIADGVISLFQKAGRSGLKGVVDKEFIDLIDVWSGSDQNPDIFKARVDRELLNRTRKATNRRKGKGGK